MLAIRLTQSLQKLSIEGPERGGALLSLADEVIESIAYRPLADPWRA